MKRISKQVVTILLSIMLLFSVIPLGTLTASAAGGVKSKLDSVISSYPAESRWTGSFDGGTQCYGFAKLVIYNVFGKSNASGYTYRTWTYAGASTSGMNVIGSITSYSESSVKNLLSKARPGDVLQFNTSKQHSMIVYSVNSNSVTIYDCNWDNNCGIRLKECSFGTWSGRNSSKLTLLRSDNYDSVDGSSSCNCSTSYAGTYICTTSSLNLTIRSGHGSSYSSVGSIPSGAAVTVTKASGRSSSDWAHVTYNGVSGYASMQYLSKKQEHTHSYTTYLKEAEHPHRISVRCKDYDTCGSWKLTDDYAKVKTCQQCWYFNTLPDKTSVTISTDASTEVTLNTSMFYPDSAIMSIDYDTSIIDATINSGVVKFTGKSTGSTNYKILVYSDSSKSYLIGSCTIKVTVTKNYNVSFSKSSVSLARPSKTKDTVTVTLSGNWPDNAGYIFEYDNNIISYTQDVATFTLKAKKAGTTNFTIKIVDKDNNSIVYDYDTCIVRVVDDTYTIKYDANGGIGAPTSQTKTYDQVLALSSAKPTREGYTFLGWATSSSATSATYKPGDNFTSNSGGTLYAVWEKITIRSVKIQFEPHKTEYYIGDLLNYDGLQLKVVYSDGLEKYITSGFIISVLNSATAGTKTITVSYGGFTNTFNVTVKTPSVTISSLSKTMDIGDVATLTATTIPAEQNITWTSSDTNIATVSNGTITAKAAGTATITAKFTYNGYTYSKNCVVTVMSAPEPVVLTSVSVSSLPKKTVYEIGESLNTAGFALKLTYSDGTTSTITSGFTTSGFSSTSAGTKTVTVLYNGKTTSFNVTVNAAPIDENKATFVVNNQKVHIGETFIVPVIIKNNPGVTNVQVLVEYDMTKLELVSVSEKDFSGASFGPITANPIAVSWSDTLNPNNTKDGILAELTFRVKDNKRHYKG